MTSYHNQPRDSQDRRRHPTTGGLRLPSTTNSISKVKTEPNYTPSTQNHSPSIHEAPNHALPHAPVLQRVLQDPMPSTAPAVAPAPKPHPPPTNLLFHPAVPIMPPPMFGNNALPGFNARARNEHFLNMLLNNGNVANSGYLVAAGQQYGTAFVPAAVSAGSHVIGSGLPFPNNGNVASSGYQSMAAGQQYGTAFVPAAVSAGSHAIGSGLPFPNNGNVASSGYQSMAAGQQYGTAFVPAAVSAGSHAVGSGLPFPSQQNSTNMANERSNAPSKSLHRRKREGEKNTKTAQQLRILSQRAQARQASGKSNSTAAIPQTPALVQALIPAEPYTTFTCFEQLPLEIQIMIWKYFLANWCRDPSNGRIVEIWLRRRDLWFQNDTRNPYKFLSPTALPFVFTLSVILAREAEAFFDKMFITSFDGKPDTCIRVLPGIDTFKLSPIRGIGAGQNPASHICDALEGLNTYEPGTIAAMKNLAVPVPFSSLPEYAEELAAGLKLCGGLKKVVLLTEYMPCTPGSLAVAKRKFPDGNLALGPPRYNSQTYNAWNAVEDEKLVRRKLRAVTSEQHVQGIEIVAHNLVSGAERWGAYLSSTQEHVPTLASKDSA